MEPFVVIWNELNKFYQIKNTNLFYQSGHTSVRKFLQIFCMFKNIIWMNFVYSFCHLCF